MHITPINMSGYPCAIHIIVYSVLCCPIAGAIHIDYDNDILLGHPTCHPESAAICIDCTNMLPSSIWFTIHRILLVYSWTGEKMGFPRVPVHRYPRGTRDRVLHATISSFRRKGDKLRDAYNKRWAYGQITNRDREKKTDDAKNGSPIKATKCKE